MKDLCPGSEHPVLVGFDTSDAARDALRLGALLAEPFGAPLRAIWARTGDPAGAAETAVQRAFADAAGERAELVSLPSRSAPSALHDYAISIEAGAIALGSTHRAGLGRVFPGGVARRLLHGAPCAVAIAPRGYESSAPPDVRVVEIGFDGSPEAWTAVAVGGAIAAAAGATVRLFAVAGPPSGGSALAGASGVAAPPPAAVADQLHDEVQRALAALPSGLRPDGRVVAAGDAATRLLEEAEKGIDLLVIGSRGYGPVRYALVGSVSGAVTRGAPCPVLLVPRGADAGEPAGGTTAS